MTAVSEQTPSPPLAPPPAAPAARGKSSAGLGIVVLLVVAGLVIWLVAKGGGSSTPASTASVTQTVTYQLTGTATAVDITMRTPGGGTSQQQGITLPLTRKSDATEGLTFQFHSGEFVYLSAQISEESGGDVVCVILEGSTIISTSTASGFPSIVTCEGSA